MKVEHFLFPSVFSKLRIRVSEGHILTGFVFCLAQPLPCNNFGDSDV